MFFFTFKFSKLFIFVNKTNKFNVTPRFKVTPFYGADCLPLQIRNSFLGFSIQRQLKKSKGKSFLTVRLFKKVKCVLLIVATIVLYQVKWWTFKVKCFYTIGINLCFNTVIRNTSWADPTRTCQFFPDDYQILRNVRTYSCLEKIIQTFVFTLTMTLWLR